MRMIRAIQNDYWSVLDLFIALLAEFRRPVAAERRYEALKGADGGWRWPRDLPRCIFDEFYSSGAMAAAPRSARRRETHKPGSDWRLTQWSTR